ncbi:hypothetical protein SVAN01_01807 [Stagonosporopsis vannaccii]|nr:hypothetical protein SVAN01_01807 [Stagonosporopsis vannaccii]
MHFATWLEPDFAGCVVGGENGRTAAVMIKQGLHGTRVSKTACLSISNVRQASLKPQEYKYTRHRFDSTPHKSHTLLEQMVSRCRGRHRRTHPEVQVTQGCQPARTLGSPSTPHAHDMPAHQRDYLSPLKRTQGNNVASKLCKQLQHARFKRTALGDDLD